MERVRFGCGDETRSSSVGGRRGAARVLDTRIHIDSIEEIDERTYKETLAFLSLYNRMFNVLSACPDSSLEIGT